ncbi:MAG: AAA family ATPase [Nitrososphaerota archaeon]|nr:AAA family ATPase [Nitrososphaerota archaeon]
MRVSFEDVENAIRWAYSTVNILPTPDQIESIASPSPILINGQAGTGKTSMLAIRAGFAFQFHRQAKSDAKLLCTAYSRLVVDVLKRDVTAFTLYKLREPAGPEQTGISKFSTFSSVLAEQLEDTQRSFYSHREKRVAFGRFNREFFQPRRTHGVFGTGVSAEFAWYAIRCFYKGYLEDDGPPTIDDFGSNTGPRSIPRRLTRELSPEAIRASEEVFKQYTAWLHEQTLFDDIDLARAAWRRVRDLPPRSYDEIYLDEAQDLTRVEFLVLRALLKPGSGNKTERARIVLAGDPQQTINPTGFNWRDIKAFFWNGEELKQTNLRTNYRTPQPIVDLANAIQRRRHHYGMEDLVEQEAQTHVGLKPICYQIESPKDDASVEELLRSTRPSAVIVWAEDDDEIVQLLKHDKHINKVAREILGDARVDKLESGMVEPRDLDTLMAKMRIHSVSEVKGLEFECVVLYKLGSNPLFAQFAPQTVADLPVEQDFEARIPVLYHLNRLYVAITRSSRHLFIVDKPEAVTGVWSRFPEIDQSRLHQLHSLQSDPALSSAEQLDWTTTGKQYLQRFQEERVVRWLVHALTCFERARDDAEARSLLVQTQAELKEQDAIMAEQKGASPSSRAVWKEAGDLWDQNSAFYHRAAECYVKAEAWPEVERVLGASPKLPSSLEGCYLYARFRNDSRGDERTSAVAYLEFLGRNKELPREDEWVAVLSRRLLRLKDVDGLVRLHGEICWSGNRGELKHPTILVDTLASLDRPDEIVRFIERQELQRPLWKAYSDALRKLALQAESQEDWANAGRLWRAIAQQAPNQEANVTEYARGGAAYARAALGGHPQYWSDTASCYTEAGSAYDRQREVSDAETIARTGGIVPGIKTLASATVRAWNSDGPLKEIYSDRYCHERIIAWSSMASPTSLARDWDALGAVIDSYNALGRREECKIWLRDFSSKAAGHSNLVIRKLATLEEEDQEFQQAILDFERAGELEKAWSLARKHAQVLKPVELARMEGKLLAWRYEHQKEPSRGDADRSINLLIEGGEVSRAREVKALRLSREVDPMEKARLVFEDGVNSSSYLEALRLSTITGSSEGRSFLLETLAQNPSVRDKSSDDIRAVTRGWLSDPNLQRSLRKRLSSEEYGIVVEFASDELSAKAFFLAEAPQHEWARDAYRRTIHRLTLAAAQSYKVEGERKEFVEGLERELDEERKCWAEPMTVGPGPSGADLLLMRTTLEGESLSKLRERCREAGLPEISGAGKEILVEVYLAFWVGTQKGAKEPSPSMPAEG